MAFAHRSPTLPSVQEDPAPAEFGAHFPDLHSVSFRQGSPERPFVQTWRLCSKSSAQKLDSQSAATSQICPSFPSEQRPDGAPIQWPLLQSAAFPQRSPMAPLLQVPLAPELAPTQTFPFAQSAPERHGEPETPVEHVPMNELGGRTHFPASQSLAALQAAPSAPVEHPSRPEESMATQLPEMQFASERHREPGVPGVHSPLLWPVSLTHEPGEQSESAEHPTNPDMHLTTVPRSASHAAAQSSPVRQPCFGLHDV